MLKRITELILSSQQSSEKDLIKTRQMLNDVLDTIPVRVFWKDLDGVYLGCNRLFAEDSGFSSPEEITGLTDFDIRDPQQANANREDDREVIERNEARINYEEVLYTSEGRKNWILTSKSPLRNTDGVTYGVLGTYKDITERKQIEEELVRQKNRLTNILEGSRIGTWEWDFQNDIKFINEYWAEIIGCKKDELPLEDKNFWRLYIHPEDLVRSETLLQQHLSGELENFECEYRMQHKNGSWVWVLSRGKAVSRSESGEPLILCGTLQDISKRKSAEAEIRHQLAEKDTIIKETNHRIKNNIASIESILSLQADSLDNPEAAAALHDAIGRIHSMQVLYERLLFDNDNKQTSIKIYLNDLITDMLNVFENSGRIIIEKRIEDLKFPSRYIFYLGLIVNELITNAFKYAFEGKDTGLIRIILEQNDDLITLTIEDDGIGLPDNFDMNNSRGFGLTLVRILTEQLGGEITSTGSSERGAGFILKFKQAL